MASEKFGYTINYTWSVNSDGESQKLALGWETFAIKDLRFKGAKENMTYA